MDQNQAEFFVGEGFKLYQEGDFIGAKNNYKKAIELSDPSYWGLTDYYSGYAMVLRALGEITKVTDQLELALSAALDSDEKTSITVKLARHALAEHFVGIGEFQKSLDVLELAMKIDSEKDWLLCYVAALAYCKLGKQDKCEEFASQVMFLAPKGKFSSFKNLLIELDLKKFEKS